MHGRGEVLRDMVNERAVRILLECILVYGFIWKRCHFPFNFIFLHIDPIRTGDEAYDDPPEVQPNQFFVKNEEIFF